MSNFDAKEVLKMRWRARRSATPSVVEIAFTSLQHPPGPLSQPLRKDAPRGVDERR
jgi:hypothetical protein